MSDFWTPEIQKNFHQALETLHRVTDKPCEEVVYRDQQSMNSSTDPHRLRFEHERQTADHFAYLAHSQQGVEAISAVCLEEHAEGLVVRLASNHTPSEATVSGLEKLLGSICVGVTEMQSRNDLEERLFDDVLSLSQERILQRMRPSWLKLPDYMLFRPKRSEPLWVRLNAALDQFQTILRQRLPYILTRSRELVSTLKRLDQEANIDARKTLLRNIVEQCAGISYCNGSSTLEVQIVSNQVSDMASRRVVSEIDKISRYYGLCRDLSRIAIRPRYRRLFKGITLQHLEAPPGLDRLGSTMSCYVHAEVQLILYYERYRLDGPPPRVIGGSKSACFMCDLLIRKVAKYRISYAHRRLYTQWTIPDAPWMMPEQADSFQHIVVSMTDELQTLTKRIKKLKVAGGSRPYIGDTARESRAVLLLRSELSTTELSDTASSRTVTQVTEIKEEHASPLGTGSVTPVPGVKKISNSKKTPLSLRPSSTIPSSTVSSLHLSKSDLPYEQLICPGIPHFHLSLGELSVLIEFVSAITMKFSVKEVQAQDRANATRVDVMDVPTEDGMNLPRSEVTSDFKVRLYNGPGFEIEIEVSSGC